MLEVYYRDLKLSNNVFYSKKSLFNYDNRYSTHQPLLISQNIQKKKKNYNFIFRNLAQKLINQYCQETVYLSKTNHESELSVNKLKSKGLSIYKGNDHKRFLTNFHQALIKGEILVTLNSTSYQNEAINQITSFKYVWYKQCYLYLSYLKNIKNIFALLQKLHNQQNQFVYNSFPLFNIINDSKFIIMAESGEQMSIKINNFLLLRKRLTDKVLYNNNINTIYNGLFFINFEDAKEYKNYIHYKNISSSRNDSLKLFISPLYIYSKLLNLSPQNAEFRIIPDLREISKLVHKYQYYKNVNFSTKQKYGRNYFQGQPIYFIEPVNVKHNLLNQMKVFNYNYLNSYKEYKVAFLNYDTAILAWNKYKEKYVDYNLPEKPLIKIYNLEDSLNLYLKSNKDLISYDTTNNIILVPSLKTYMFIKKYIQEKNQYIFKEVLFSQFILVKQYIQRIMWSFTSKQPMS